MRSILRFGVSLLALGAAVSLRAQNTVFDDSLTADQLNPASYPAVSATATGWTFASNKSPDAPTEAGGILTINMASTTSGFIEAQALFAPAPVQLLPGTYIELKATFVPTNVLIAASDNLIVGLFNSGGSAPLTGLMSGLLVNTQTGFSNGGAKGWVGFNANVPISGNPRVLTRPAQSGSNNTVQDVVVAGQSGSVGYAGSTSASGVTAFSTNLTSGSTYTIDYRLALSADGGTLTSTTSMYNGAGTTGIGSNTLIGSSSGRFTGSALLTKAFDAMAIGWRADAGAKSNIQISDLKVITTGGAPWFTVQPPSDLLASLGSDLTITTSVAGTVGSLHWQKSSDGGATFVDLDSNANPSAATATLTLANVQNVDAGAYHLVASNAAGSNASSNVTVTVTTSPVAPTVITPPAGGTVQGGSPFTFSVVVNGTSPLSYQWLFSPDGGSYTPIPNATAAQYTIPAVSLANEGFYEVTATNVSGSTTSAPVQLLVNQPVTITTQPVGATLNVNDSYTLVAAAVGKPAPTYQWSLNGAAISGATDATYTITGATAASAGLYTVTATNDTTSATSDAAAVAVLSPTLAVAGRTPVLNAGGVSPDTRLTLTFNQPVAVGWSGQIRIYDTANATTPVDTIDIVAGRALMQTLRAGSPLSTQPLPVQTKTIGGLANFDYYPITVAGNTATIYPRNNVLAYGHSYYVIVEPGVFTDASGLAYAGIPDASGWTFSTKNVGPGSDASRIVVAADGTGDFTTVQAAIDSLPAGNTAPRTIYIRTGTYFEQIYFNAKHAVTFLGEDRTGTVITYPNNNNFNNLGTTHRGVMCADKSNNIAVVNLTVYNSTPQNGSQAESLVLNGTATTQGIISNVDLVSFQDTLLLNGQGYVANSHITGDVDFMWGNGPNFFVNCELTGMRSAGYYTQIRNSSTGHGNVYLNCTLDAPAGITGMYLGRIDPTAAGFPFSEVVYLNCVMGTAAHVTPIGAAGWLLNNTPDQTAASAPNVHFWEYNSHYADGTPLDVSGRIGAARQLTLANDAATIANYSDPAIVLGGWTPQLAPVIATQPVAQTIDQGAGLTLGVTAFGIPAVSYQWTRNGTPIAGATDATYTVPSSGVNDAGTYAVVVSNGAASVTSATVPVLVHGAAPVILLQPTDASALPGATATLGVAAAGDGPLSYQWSKDGHALPGATNASLRLAGVQPADAGSYAVAVSNANGTTTSAVVTVSLDAPATTMPALPVIPAARFDVTTYGAIGDGATDNTDAIQGAINAASAAGGGTVELPPAGAPYLSGPLTIPSNIDLQVDAGATLQALPFGVYPRSTTAPAHFITVASGSTNIEFSGGGVIDGDGAAWWAAFDSGAISNRPRLVQFTKETNVLITGLTFRNSPNFHLAFSGANNNVTIYGVTISAPGDSPNTDGMDLAGSNFLVQHCSVSDGDDNIVAKPGSVFCQNLYIADCTFGTGHGVSVGGQTNVGMDGMTVTNCTFNGTDTGLRLKADATQGGPVRNLTYSNLTMTNVTYPIVFYSYYNQIGSPGAKSGSSQTTIAKVNAYNTNPPNSLASSTLPTWQNITISNLTATGASGYSILWGLPLGNGLISNVRLQNVSISGGAGFEIYDATDVQFSGTTDVGPFVTDNALAITQQPQAAATDVGGSVSFTVGAIGGSGSTNSTATYQWALNGVPLTDGPQADGSVVTGSTTATLSLGNVHATGAGNYTVTVSNTLDGYDIAANALSPNSLPVSATSAPAVLTVHPLAATLSLSNLEQTYDGTVKAPTVTTTPAGIAVQLTYDHGVTPINAGSYPVTATIADPDYTAPSVSGTLVIDPAPATVALTNLSVVYDGTPQAPTATTTPAGLSVQFTYDGSVTAPTNAGSYAVVATISDPNYRGTTSDTLVIAKATPVLVWPAPAAITYGTPLGAVQLDASTNVPGAFAYSPGPGTVLNAGANQALTVVFTPADPLNYTAATAATTITVNPAAVVISLGNLVQPYDGLPKTVSVTTMPANLAVDVTYAGDEQGPVFPGQYPVLAVVDDPNYSASTTGTLTVSVTALVRHAPVLNGGIDGSVQVLSGEDIVLNGSAWISGDLLVPGTPSLRLNGLPMIAGTMDEDGSTSPSRYSVTLNGRSVLRYLIRRIDPIAMPVVAAPPAPTGTRSVTLNARGDNPGSFATLRNLTLNGNAGMVAVPAGTYGQLTANGNAGFVFGHAGATQPDVYNLQALTLNGGSRLQIAGPVVIVLASGTTVNGAIGDADHAEWLTMAIANGGLTLNGNASLGAYVVAPNGSVLINGSATLTGEVISDRLTINGAGQVVEP